MPGARLPMRNIRDVLRLTAARCRQSMTVVAPIDRLAAILRLDMPAPRHDARAVLELAALRAHQYSASGRAYHSHRRRA